MKLIILLFISSLIYANDLMKLRENLINNNKSIPIKSYKLFKNYNLNDDLNKIINKEDVKINCSEVPFNYNHSKCYLKKETINFLKKEFYLTLSFFNNKLIQVNIFNTKPIEKIDYKYFEYFTSKFNLINFTNSDEDLTFNNLKKINNKFIKSSNEVFFMNFVEIKNILKNNKIENYLKDENTQRIITFKEIKNNENLFFYSFDFINPNSSKIILLESKKIENNNNFKFKDIDESF